MLIDWFTVGAQALNFLILVWLMKRFLYQPILNAIDAREQRIAAQLADADAKKTEAARERDGFQHKNAEFDLQRATLLIKATDEANVERQRLLDAARKAADALTAKRQESLVIEARNLSEAITRRTQQEVFAIARKTLADLATTSLEERMGDVLVRRLHELDGQGKAALAVALKASSEPTESEPTLVRSAFELAPAQRTAIQAALSEICSSNIQIRFDTAPELISGIEFTANGQKVAWSISDYLASLEKEVGDLSKQQSAPQPKTEATPEEPTPVPKAA